MTDALTVRPGEAVTYHTPAREPVAYNGEKLSLLESQSIAIPRAPSRDLTAEQKLRTVLDALLDLGHGEVLLHGVPRAELIAWAGIHRLGVACDDDIATRVTRVLHRDGKTLLWNWQAA